MTLIKRNGRINTLPTVWDDFLNQDVFNWGSGYQNSSTTMPAVNIKENQDNFQVEMVAPGMKKEDFKIQLDGHTLTITCEKQDQKEERDDETYSGKEFNYASFYRTFHLPKDVVNSDKIEAKYENGLLNLVIPKREEARQMPARLISIS